jgi:hypothetical protein
VSFFLAAVPDRGETVIVNLANAYDQVSLVFSLFVIIHVSHVVLQLSDGTNYLVANAVNSPRQGCV